MKLYWHIFSERGYLLYECLLGIMIIVTAFTLALPLLLNGRNSEKEELRHVVNDMTMQLRYVQQSCMYGHLQAINTKSYMFVMPDGYALVNGTKQLGKKIYYPNNIISLDAQDIFFTRYGEPRSDMRINLRQLDQNRKFKRQGNIYIAVQTGRIRWDILE